MGEGTCRTDSEELQSGFLIPTLGCEAFKYLGLVMFRPSEVVLFAIDRHEHLIEVPAPVLAIPHGLNPIATDFGDDAIRSPQSPSNTIRPLQKKVLAHALHA